MDSASNHPPVNPLLNQLQLRPYKYGVIALTTIAVPSLQGINCIYGSSSGCRSRRRRHPRVCHGGGGADQLQSGGVVPVPLPGIRPGPAAPHPWLLQRRAVDERRSQEQGGPAGHLQLPHAVGLRRSGHPARTNLRHPGQVRRGRAVPYQPLHRLFSASFV